MGWTIRELTVGWPPTVKLVRAASDIDALHPLFTALAGKRLLLFGYGRSSGVSDLDDLAQRIDALRNELFLAMTRLQPDAAVATWLRKVEQACHELLGKVYDEMRASDPRTEASEITGAVNELRDAFQFLAERIAQAYKLPAAEVLWERVAKDRQQANQE